MSENESWKQWIVFLADSLARTSRLVANEQALQGIREVDSGLSSLGVLANYDPASCSWKTSMTLFPSEQISSPLILPRWGMTRSGSLCSLPMWVRRISVNGGSAWPTPAATDATRQRASIDSINPILTKNGTLRHLNKQGTQSQIRPPEVVKLWALPTASARHRSGPYGGKAHRFDVAKRHLKGQVIEEGGGTAINPAWELMLMGYPTGWLDTDTPQDKVRGSIPTSRRAHSGRPVRTGRQRYRRAATPSSRRWPTR